MMLLFQRDPCLLGRLGDAFFEIWESLPLALLCCFTALPSSLLKLPGNELLVFWGCVKLYAALDEIPAPWEGSCLGGGGCMTLSCHHPAAHKRDKREPPVSS